MEQVPTLESLPQPDTSLQSIIESTNIATKVDEEKLELIGEECWKGYENDLTKLNIAQHNGFKVYQFTYEMLMRREYTNFI